MTNKLLTTIGKNKYFKWLPAIIIMIVIFWFSSQPGDSLPNFDWADRFVKKSGHVIVYGLLSSSYWYGLNMKRNRQWMVWLMSIIYALSDEYHQMFTKLRHPSLVDVALFDNLGVLLGLWLSGKWLQTEEKNYRDE